MHIHLIDAVVKGILVGLFMAISVGPTLFAVIKYSLTLSYKAGLAFVLGVSFSDIMYVTLANVAASWLENLKPYEREIAFGGAIVLIGVGLAGLIRKQKPQTPSSAPVTISGAHYFKIWGSGFLINTLNPGAFISWLTAVTLTANTSDLYRFILFGTALLLVLCVDFSKVFLAEKIKNMLTPRRVVYVQRFSAICVLLIGAMLAISTAFNIQSKKKNNKPGKLDRILTYSGKENCAVNKA